LGLGIIENYRYAEKCIKNVTGLYLRYRDVFIGLNTPTANLDTYGLWLELALSMGNTSTTYKGCIMSTEGSLYELYYHLLSYRSFTNYILYLLPNLLSYAFVISTWIDRIKALDKARNITGLAYYYGMIVKNVFFFTIPEAEGWDGGTQYSKKSMLLAKEASEDMIIFEESGQWET
jgi:hypothetical protein